MPKKVLQVMAAVAFVAAVGTAAFFIAGRFAGGEASGQPTSEADDWIQELAKKLEPTVRADQALPRVRGAYGDFVIVGMDPSGPEMDVLCPRDSNRMVDDIRRIQRSELYAAPFGDNPEAYDCADGTISFLGAYIQDSETSVTEFGRYYFVGPAIIEREAPLERLKLATIEGHPALIEEGLNTPPFPVQNSIFVIERFPGDAQPGIMVVVFTPKGVDEGIELAKELMQ